MNQFKEIFSFIGKKAIVTGANQGIGYAIAYRYSQAGAEVVLMDIADTIDDTAKRITEETGSLTYSVKIDLTNRDATIDAFNKALGLLNGKIDILVNCAGIQKACDTIDFKSEDWDRILAVNLDAVFFLCQLAGKIMINQNEGKIINIASMISYIGGFRVPAYAASKGAVMQLTKSLSNEWASKGINVNAIAPGFIDTPLNKKLFANEERSSFYFNRVPISRWGTPDDIAKVAVFLASEASDYISGTIIPVDGGFLGN